MLREFFEGGGPYLAVVDGRFLPLDDLSVDITHDLAKSSTIGASTDSMVQRGASELVLTITTRRDPMMRNHHEITSRMYIYNRDYRLTLSNFEQVQYGISLDFGEAYEMEFSALDWEIEERPDPKPFYRSSS